MTHAVRVEQLQAKMAGLEARPCLRVADERRGVNAYQGNWDQSATSPPYLAQEGPLGFCTSLQLLPYRLTGPELCAITHSAQRRRARQHQADGACYAPAD